MGNGEIRAGTPPFQSSDLKVNLEQGMKRKVNMVLRGVLRQENKTNWNGTALLFIYLFCPN